MVEWSELLKKDWLERNFEASIESISHEILVNLLISKIHEQSTEILMMKHTIDNLNSTVLKQTEQFEQLFNYLKGQSLANSQYSPQKKRKT